MAKIKRTSAENMFSKKGSVQPQKKEVVLEKETVDTPVIKEEAPVEEPKKAPAPKKEESPKEKKTENKPSQQSNIGNLFAKKKEKGKQQTIYFKKDVYDFCDGLAKQYGYGISDVVNRLIESIMEEE